ncbi:MAG TPA: DUF4870 domain-containing protein [Rubrobacter sp.]|nr:DUF4870 domain-containing protein [Rubrobacter sp.]
MEARDRNYGVVGDEVAGEEGTRSQGSVTMQTQEEKTWSVLAHLSIFLNLVTGFLGPVAALVIWLVYRDRSSRVAFQALQSMWYQVAWLVILAVGWTVTTLLMIILIGFLLVPVMALITVVPFVHSAYAAYRVSRDGEYRYPLIADLIEGR